ncbi:MAG: hypothetical protein ACREQ9_11195, partial [Candidatus Binatia bacterium]
AMYWAMPRLGSDRSAEAEQNLQDAAAALQAGDATTAQRELNQVGTPGNLGTETDVSGICTECEPGL